MSFQVYNEFRMFIFLFGVKKKKRNSHLYLWRLFSVGCRRQAVCENNSKGIFLGWERKKFIHRNRQKFFLLQTRRVEHQHRFNHPFWNGQEDTPSTKFILLFCFLFYFLYVYPSFLLHIMLMAFVMYLYFRVYYLFNQERSLLDP